MKLRMLNVAVCLATVFSASAAAPAEAKREILFLDAAPYQKYLADWCDKGNDCTSGTGGRFTGDQSDCAHFVAHALAAGGVRVTNPEVSCAKGLAVRALDLRHWLDQASARYVNVEQVPSWQSTKAFDIGFIEYFYVRRWDIGFDAVHALVLAEPSKEKGGIFFAHTNQRCGKEEVSYGKEVLGVLIDRPIVFFRINPSPLDAATWAEGGNPAASRFTFQFTSRKVTLKERGLESAQSRTQTRELTLEDGPAQSYIIRRPNDDATLQLLSYTDAGLRQAILAKNPEPSTLTIRLGADLTLTVEWRGLRVKKNPNGSFAGIAQPSTSAPTTFIFKRSS